MSSFIHESIFNIKPITEPTSIKQFEKYMLSIENLKKISSYCGEEPIVETKIEIKEQKPKNDNIISPRMEDGLFWCVFIAGKSYQDFINIGTKYKNQELHEKQKIIEFIKKTPSCMKSSNMKLSNVAIQEIMSDRKSTRLNSSHG